MNRREEFAAELRADNRAESNLAAELAEARIEELELAI